ncbi:hypothetical protein ETB97_012273 [Aspergillus alliaceus]|uniref:Nucleoside phosphorylase domain-containing protein n=1 Tax=Petromyces alliaceus TaxID=209559 RepID=A0A8H6A8W5_PETAA|nr:hypothetical protein ETB97_012273 [Aspergillus burnettii]
MTLIHDDYTVGWICALPLEMAAAKIMLDEVHPSLRQPQSDHNVYTLGSISGHNVVVACLPSGVYGTTSAAIVLAHMVPTFPSLQFALMVGIGGSVPSQGTDIRLGDVVVSMPAPTSGGVIQYDYGKSLHDGRFQRTGSLNKPPQVLLTAVSQIRSDTMIGKLSIGVIISDVLQKPENCQQFSRPDQDWLFNSTYDHQSRRPSCSTCDQTQLVHRAPRETNEPHIHYGLIASGNQVMRDAKRRDLITQDIDILCFEMEAAGLMDQLPCLVIRGICDYCDSHKHKQWQGYAALTAAAYTKKLLSVVPLAATQEVSRKSFPVQRLATDDAIQLLLLSSGPSAGDTIEKEPDQDVADLTNRLDGLPLAIVIAGAFMRETGTGIKEYLQYYRDSWADLQSQSAATRHYQQGNILETWMISYREVQRRDRMAAALLLFLAYFDNRDIWYELIECGRNYSNIPDWLEMSVKNKLAFKARIKTLLGFSLVETKPQEESYGLHPVVQNWCLHVAATENHTISLYNLALVSVGYMVPSTDDRHYARLQQRLLPHANHLIQKEAYNYADNTSTIWGAFQDLGNLYSDQGKLKEAEAMYQRSLAGKEKALGPDHISTLDTVHNLGILYKDQGRLKEAEAMYQRALTGLEKELGLDHISIMNTINSLGNLYSHQGKLKEAEVMYQRALTGFEKALGPDHTSTLNTVHNLGILYRDHGRLKEAEAMYQRALTGYEKALGPNHSKARMVSNNLISLPRFIARTNTLQPKSPHGPIAFDGNSEDSEISRPRRREFLYKLFNRK